jgi:hypothetical protein
VRLQIRSQTFAGPTIWPLAPSSRNTHSDCARPGKLSRMATAGAGRGSTCGRPALVWGSPRSALGNRFRPAHGQQLVAARPEPFVFDCLPSRPYRAKCSSVRSIVRRADQRLGSVQVQPAEPGLLIRPIRSAPAEERSFPAKLIVRQALPGWAAPCRSANAHQTHPSKRHLSIFRSGTPVRCPAGSPKCVLAARVSVRKESGK